MSELSKQATLLATFGLATAFTLGTWFGDAVRPDEQCSSPEGPAPTQTIVPPEHNWQDTPKASQQPSIASPQNDSTPPDEQRWHNPAPLPGPK